MKKNRFARYFFEFVIVFLAVFLGFLADSFRETLSDTAREKRYAEGVLADLEADSIALKYLITSAKNQVGLLDSLLQLHTVDLNNVTNLKTFYRRLVKAKPFAVFIFQANETTIAQLKSTGDLRLMEGSVANALSNYYNAFSYMGGIEDHVKSHAEETFRMAYKFANMVNITGRSMRDDFVPQRLHADEHQLKHFFNLINDLARTHGVYIGEMEKQQELNGELMLLLKEVYNL